jgi:hypothetical protein
MQGLEQQYLEKLLRNKLINNNIKKMIVEFLDLNTKDEILDFAKKMNFYENGYETLKIDELKEKIAYKLGEFSLSKKDYR